jgi:hypothetical protein
MKSLRKRIGSVLQATVNCVLFSPWTDPTFLHAQQSDESPVQSHFRAGQEAIEQGNNGLGVKEFQTALRLDPGLGRSARQPGAGVPSGATTESL